MKRAEGQSALGRVVRQGRDRGTEDDTSCRPITLPRSTWRCLLREAVTSRTTVGLLLESSGDARLPRLEPHEYAG